MSNRVLFPNGIIPDGYSGEEEDPGKVMSIILHITTYLFPFLFLTTTYLSLINLKNLNLLWTVIPAFAISWVLGDFISGIIHWLCDTYGSVDTPVVGQTLIRNFRSHHKYPKDICVSPFAFTVGYVATVAFFTLPIFLFFLLRNQSSFIIAISSFTYGIITFLTVLTNQFHQWAHNDNNADWIKLLQRKGIILSPSHHKFHHTTPFNSNYCITHGLSNYFLEKIGFFRKTEAFLAKLGIYTSI